MSKLVHFNLVLSLSHRGVHSICAKIESASHERSTTRHGQVRSTSYLGLPLTSSLLLEYSSEYLSEYSSTR